MKNDKQQPIEAKQFTFDQKDTVMGWAREKGRPYLQGMHPKFGPNKEPILCIRHEQDEPIEVNINDWIVLTDKGLIACTPADYESNYKQQPSFREIDKHLQKCMDRGVKAFLDGLTKYDNDFEPGSLDFDAWASGFSIAENGFQAPLSQTPMQ